MTTQSAAILSSLADLDRAAAGLSAAQQAAQERQPPQPPALTPDEPRQAEDVAMCQMIAVWLGWHYTDAVRKSALSDMNT